RYPRFRGSRADTWQPPSGRRPVARPPAAVRRPPRRSAACGAGAPSIPLAVRPAGGSASTCCDERHSLPHMTTWSCDRPSPPPATPQLAQFRAPPGEGGPDFLELRTVLRCGRLPLLVVAAPEDR